MENHSPWLNFKRPQWNPLTSDLTCDVAIIGAGISGIATLYYLLTTTQKNVILLERNHVASGATGHNAGLAVVAIEKPLSELGERATHQLFAELDRAWDELHAMHTEIGLKDNLLSFPYIANGFNSLASFIASIEDSILRGNQDERIYLAAENIKDQVPSKFANLIEFVPQKALLEALKTIDTSYIAGTIYPPHFKAKRMNSARFCYQVLDYLQMKFPGRFSVYEQTNMTKINLHENHTVLESEKGKIHATDVILCTNAYKDFSIWDHTHHKPYTKLHDSIRERIGYLAAFPASNSSRHAIAFMNEQKPFDISNYWYFFHAPHPNHDPKHASIIGGPEFEPIDGVTSAWVEEKDKISSELIQQFLQHTFKETPKNFSFFWHGWMGYTPDGLRWVGPDSEHPHLWYNLGCNGIGIVPAIAGAKKIATLIT